MERVEKELKSVEMKQEDQEGEKKVKNQPNIRSYFKKLNKSAEKKEEQQNSEKKTKI